MVESHLPPPMTPVTNRTMPTSDELHAAAVRVAVAKLNEVTEAAQGAGLMVEFDEQEYTLADHRGVTRYTRVEVSINKPL